MYTVDKELFAVDTAGINPLEEIPAGNGYLFVFKVSGEMKTAYGSYERTLASGKAAVFELGNARFVSDTGSTAYFTVHGSLCDSLMRLYGIGDGFTVNTPEASGSFFAMCRAFGEGNVAEQTFIFHSILKALLAANHTPSKKDTPLLIKEYLDAHAREKVTLDEVAEVFFLSKSQIFRLFKARYGISPMQYYTDKKVEAAREMLISTDMRISDIAEMLAFSDAKHLAKAFKNATGMLPRSFRKEHKTARSE